MSCVVCESYGVQNEPGYGRASCDVQPETFGYSFTQLVLMDFFSRQLLFYKFLTSEKTTTITTFKKSTKCPQSATFCGSFAPLLSTDSKIREYQLFTFGTRKRWKLSPMNPNLNQVNLIHSYMPYFISDSIQDHSITRAPTNHKKPIPLRFSNHTSKLKLIRHTKPLTIQFHIMYVPLSSLGPLTGNSEGISGFPQSFQVGTCPEIWCSCDTPDTGSTGALF